MHVCVHEFVHVSAYYRRTGEGIVGGAHVFSVDTEKCQENIAFELFLNTSLIDQSSSGI